MANRLSFKWLLGLAASLVLTPLAFGLGLGEITIHSNLNQPLDAEVQITSATRDELSSLILSVPDKEVFDRYDVELISILNDLQFQVVNKPDGSRVVRVTSSRVVQDPFLTFLMEANWSQGRILREYTVLVDPPLFIPSQQSSSATETTPYVAPAVTGTESSSVAQGNVQRDEVRVGLPPQTYPGDRYRQEVGGESGQSYQVRRGDTLWEIANDMKPDSSFSVNQTMMAIYRTNQEAFDGNINRLKANRVLRIPDRVAISRITREIANEEVRAQTRSWRESVGRGTSTSLSASSGSISGQDAGSSASSNSGASPLARDEGGTLVLKVPDLSTDQTLSAGSGDGNASGSVDAAGQARIQELEQKVAEFERLLALQNNEMNALKEQLKQQYQIGTTDTTLDGLPVDNTNTGSVDTTTGAGTEIATDTGAGTSIPDTTTGGGEIDATIDTPTEPEIPVVNVSQPESAFDLAGLLQKIAFGLGGLLLVGGGGLFAYRKIKKGPSRDTLFVDDDLDLAAESIAEKVKTKISSKYEDTGLSSEIEVGETSFEEAGIEPPLSLDAPDEPEAPTEPVDLDLTGELQVTTTHTTQEMEALDGGESIESDQALPFEDTTLADASSTSLQLDQNDPLAETDFHMAYGLYDQAAELMQTAITENDSFEFKEKLLEVFFVSGNKEEFARYASEIKKEAKDNHQGSWENIVIMGKQLAPENELFSGDVGAPGLDDGLDFKLDETGSIQVDQLDIDQSLFGGDAPQDETPAEVDLDLGAADESSKEEFDDGESDDDLESVLESGEESAEEHEFALDLDEQLGLPDAPVAGVAASDDALDLDLDLDLPDAPVDLEEAIEDFSMDLDATLSGVEGISESSGEDTAESPIASWDPGDTDAVEVAELEDIDPTIMAELKNDDLTMTEEVKIADILDLDIGSPSNKEAADVDLDFSDLDLGAADLNESDDDESETTQDFGFDLDKSDDIDVIADAPDFDQSASEDASAEHDFSEALGSVADESTKQMKASDSLDLILDDGLESTTEGALDLDLEQMFGESGEEAFADDTLQSMLPDGVSDTDSGTMQLESILDKDKSEDRFSTEFQVVDDDQHTETATLSDDELSAMGLSDSGPDILGGLGDADAVDEVGTKLDLARAYIEMDDPDNAKGILQEVIEEGNDAQRSEAKDILITLG
ncbi:MAG: LysM peptidoglycan-binding domain-containing protein [Gammaproteobacteria bacterium]|nr:LysM peptidoglycan-binding domain-containing protein [Gammaproteobacteria bacterium]